MRRAHTMEQKYVASAKVYPTENLGKMSLIDMLGYFVERGAKLCRIILEKVEQLPKNYVSLSFEQLEKIINQHSVETCKFNKSYEINKFNYK